MEQKQALAERLKQANNILVTVSSNPSVDQLAACIGMTLALNKLEKHATAVFSGAIPNIIEFLEPEKTLEKNTDSLRDFIIALDKSKADKLRYKVEDTVVKIFITPYKTSINEKDLEFSQGDFNVDVVLALGVHDQADLDTAITSHGRILHDATVATVNVEPGGELGTVNWIDHDASCLSELAAELVDALNKETMDTQIATAFLTGIVAETNRFSNDKTSPMTMTISAELMAAGANQQLVATKLEPPAPKPEPLPQPIQEHADANSSKQQGDQQSQSAEPPKPNDGTLEISHEGEPQNKPADEHQSEPTPEVARPAEPQLIEEHHDEEPEARLFEAPFEAKSVPETESTPELEKPAQSEETNVPQIKIDEQGSLHMHDNLPEPGPKPEIHMDRQHMILQPPPLNGGQMSGSMLPEDDERPAGEPPLSSMPSQPGLLQRGSSSAAASFPPASAPFIPPSPVTPANPNATQTMASPFASVQPLTPPAPVLPPQPPTPMAITPTVPQQTIPTPSVFQQAPVSQPNSGMSSTLSPAPAPSLPPVPAVPPTPVQTLSQLEQNVNSPHLQQFMAPPASTQVPAPVSPLPPPVPPTPPPALTPPAPVLPPQPPTPALNPIAPPPTPSPPTAPIAETEVDSARNAVMNAYEGSEQFREPIEALNAQSFGAPLHESDSNAPQPAPQDPGTPPSMPPPMVPPAPGV